ncbi:MAG: glycosyltransferase family 39 protein [Candidatus Aureabacteria bacterium]|nr:glycosyltransferase family 39 protein [Candidatus Auribacterota bacterium]
MFQRSPIIWILGAALCLRLALPVASYLVRGDTAGFYSPDTGSYLSCARAIEAGGTFSPGGVAELTRTPGFPLLLVPGVALGHVAAVTIPVQIALGCVTVWLVYRTTLLLVGSGRAAAAAGFLCAFEPLSVIFCSLLLSETLFSALLMTALYFLMRAMRGRSPASLVFSSCALAAAVYVRPVAYWMPLPLAACLLIPRDGAAVRRRGTECVCYLAISAICIAPWQIRNYLVAGYRGFSSISAINLYFYHAAAVRAEHAGVPYDEMQRRMGYGDARMFMQRHPGLAGVPERIRLEWISGEARRIIAGNPGTFAALYLKGIARTVLGPGPSDLLNLFGPGPGDNGIRGSVAQKGLVGGITRLPRRDPALFWTSLVLGVILLGYYCLAAAGLCARRIPRPELFACAAAVCYLILISGGLSAYSRFRHPIMPVICILAGCGFDRMKGKNRFS